MTLILRGDKGQEVAVDAPEKTFKSGKKGYWGQQKAVLSGKRYQIQVQAVELAD